MGQPPAAVRLLRIPWYLAALPAVRVRSVILRPAGFQRRLRPRLDRQRTADRAPSDGRCRSREDRDHGGVDYRHPSDRQRLGCISEWRVTDRVRHLSRSLHPVGGAADRRRIDGAVRGRKRSRSRARGSSDGSTLMCMVMLSLDEKTIERRSLAELKLSCDKAEWFQRFTSLKPDGCDWNGELLTVGF